MGFPDNDKYWRDAADFVLQHIKNHERLFAPAEFKGKFFGRVYPYSLTFTGENEFQWAIIHKGRIEEIQHDILRYIANEFKPVFANEVFVVFSSHKELPKVDSASPHIQSFWGKMGFRKTFKRRISHMLKEIKNEFINFGLTHKYKIKKISLLHKIAKSVYHRYAYSREYIQ